MQFPVKLNEETLLTDEALEALIQEEWLSTMGHLKKEYQNMPVPKQAQDAVQKGIQRAKAEAQMQQVQLQEIPRKKTGKLYGGIAAFVTLAATVFLFVLFQTNTQLAVSVAKVPVLKPVVEFMTGQEYHEDVYLDLKVAHLAGQVGRDVQSAMPVPLADLFEHDADYVSVISTEIQMQIQQSKQDTTLQPQFLSITPDQCYYINTDGCLVIVLDEYETAPEFIIHTDVIAPILKDTVKQSD